MFWKLPVCIDHVCSCDSQAGFFFSSIYSPDIKRNRGGSSNFNIAFTTSSVHGKSPDVGQYYSEGIRIVTLVGILSSETSWNKLTGSLRTFHVPPLFIFTLDITLKYISILGEICVDILRAVSLRSVGKNPINAKSFSGVLGITFLKSSEMAEEMYASMCCRGFTGEY